MQTSFRNFGLSRAGFTMLARIKASLALPRAART
jgi:hypothetical protein